MKRKFSIAGGLLLFVFVLGTPVVWAAEPFAKALAVDGNAEVQKGGKGDWKDMTDGMPLDVMDVIRTAQDSKVDVTFDKELDNVLRVGENSLVTLKDKKVEIPKGRLLAKLDNLKPGTFFVAQTPAAIAGVRGSGFGVTVAGSTTEACAYEGNAYVTGLDEAGKPVGDELTVEEGMKTFVQQGFAPTKPEMMAESEMGGYREFKQEIQDLQQLSSSSQGDTGLSISPSGWR